MNKLRDNRGETLIESLVSILIAVHSGHVCGHGGKDQRQDPEHGCYVPL